VLQNCTAAECQNSTESHIASSSVQTSSASTSNGLPALESTTPLSQPGAASVDSSVPPMLTDVLNQVQELLSSMAVHGGNNVLSGCQDAVQNVLSTVTTGMAVSANCNSNDHTMFDHIVNMLLELRNSVELLTSSSAAKQSMNGSDSGHDDSNSLPPDVSGDNVIDNMDAGVPQQHLTDERRVGDEAADVADSILNENCLKTTEKRVSKLQSASVQPLQTAVALKAPEFIAQGNLDTLPRL